LYHTTTDFHYGPTANAKIQEKHPTEAPFPLDPSRSSVRAS
jgi:hypothetical protein